MYRPDETCLSGTPAPRPKSAVIADKSSAAHERFSILHWNIVWLGGAASTRIQRNMIDSRLRHSAVEFVRYFAVSLLALAVDMTILLIAARVMHYLWAATAGFVAGALTSYLLATRWVFRKRRFEGRVRAEFAVYALVGVLGLGLNDLAIYLTVEFAGLPLLQAKLVAAGVTFFFNYVIRKLVLF